MEKFKNALNIVLILLVALVLYFVVAGNSQLKQAQHTIKQVNTELSVLKDSISSTQQSLGVVIRKLEFAETELKILRTERDILELEAQQKLTKDLNQLQVLKEKIANKEAQQKALKETAQSFEL
ncbi:hypothetical protein BZG02_16525 [Labilibaculum filiforme]|uniref:Uncharacterized protein n=1 Tax=Labilibaculum filiforme TaxID=1940526 RepID=A0A2N3HT66_9BACT|nr:hypothetical protein [Labilibaculum filiforme]PKQ61237.1 hypothetical protein BZG02_16525 [Labilibaculum filiforme]